MALLPALLLSMLAPGVVAGCVELVPGRGGVLGEVADCSVDLSPEEGEAGPLLEAETSLLEAWAEERTDCADELQSVTVTVRGVALVETDDTRVTGDTGHPPVADGLHALGTAFDAFGMGTDALATGALESGADGLLEVLLWALEESVLEVALTIGVDSLLETFGTLDILPLDLAAGVELLGVLDIGRVLEDTGLDAGRKLDALDVLLVSLSVLLVALQVLLAPVVLAVGSGWEELARTEDERL